MEYIQEFIRPEMLILVPVLYLLGAALKRAATFADKFIPLALGIVGIILAALWLLGSVPLGTVQEVVAMIFSAITQGILVAGASVYVNQVIKQTTKTE